MVNVRDKYNVRFILLTESLSFIYKNDTKGFASNNTGYFLQFKQGIPSKGFALRIYIYIYHVK